ncbi:glycoside hydrolase domain-containing protein [Azospirillum largimobile]
MSGDSTSAAGSLAAGIVAQGESALDALKPATLDTAAWTEPGAEYAALRAEAIALVQAMSGDIWTDYNFSDPGVTIIEQLCYALTELPYRATLPMTQILSPPDRAQLPLRRQGLLPVRAVMPCNPVTANDLRRLVIDRVPGVANVWFTPDTSRTDGIGGLYRVQVLPSRGDDPRAGRHDRCRCDDAGDDGDGDEGGGNAGDGSRDGDRRRDLADQVTRCYAAHRGLCEDILRPVVLRDLDLRVDAVVVISEKADPSDTLAQILFALDLLLAPEPRRCSLDEMLTGDSRTTDVFVGPLMLRGFIRDSQLEPFPASVTLDQIRRAIAEAPGVSAVDGVSATVVGPNGEGPNGGPVRHGRIETAPGTIFRLQATSSEGHPTIRMIRDRAICQPEEGRTRRRLAELWRAQRRTYPLRQSYPGHYPTPRSDYRPLASYMSVQNQFPATYGIGQNSLGDRAPAVRLAQANQLKGYLMPFDQMLADGFAQLAFARDLLSVRAGGDRTYAVQSLRGIAAGADILLAPGYEEGLVDLSAQTDPVALRQNAVLDLLLSFYGFGLDPLRKDARRTDSDSPATARLLHAKRAILRKVDSLTRDRGKGLDYRRPALSRSATGVERNSRAPLDLLWAEGSRTDDSGRGTDRSEDGGQSRRDGPVEVRRPSEATFGKLLPAEVIQGVQHLFQPVGAEEDGEAVPWDGPSPLSGHRVASSLLAALHDRRNYRVVRLESSRSVVLVCIDADGRWWLIGESRSEEEIAVVMGGVIRAAGDRQWRGRRGPDLHIVEWLLLRDATGHDVGNGRRYSFRVTAVLSADPRADSADSWRSGSRDILRANTPAHVALECLYLDPPAMEEFQRLYDAWIEALRDGRRQRRSTASRRLERFLIDHGALADDDATGDATGDGAGNAGVSSPATPQPNPDRPSGGSTEPDQPPISAPSPAIPPIPTSPPAPPPPPPAPPDDATTADGEADGNATRVRDRIHRPSGRGGSSPPAPSPPPPPPASPSPSSSGTTPSDGSARRLSWLGRLLAGLRGRAKSDEDGQGGGGGTGTDTPTPSPPPAPPPSPPPPPVKPSSQARAAPPGAVGFDTDTALTASTAAAFVAAGFTFAIRYLSRGTPEEAGDLDAQEVSDILGAGLALMAVQHVQNTGWVPSQELGAQYGQAAATNAQAAGLAPGVTLWLDLEGVASDTPADTIGQYCNAWFQAVSAGGYRPGLYVGADCGLTGDQLGALQCDGFWRSGSTVPEVEPAGYCLVQTIDDGFAVDGVAYDRDVVQADNGGGTPVWMVPTARRTS